MSGERRVPVLASVTPGLSVVASLFALKVRERAAEYVGRGLVRVTKSSAERLVATVRGTETYTSAYGLRNGHLIYGCSCPFFQDRLEPCKHLWALALEASTSEVIRAAEHIDQCMPLAELPFESGASPHEGAADDDDELEDEEEFEPAEPEGARALHWHDFIEGAQREARGDRPSQIELYYFVEPELERSSFTLCLGRRKLGGRRPATLQPAERLHGSDLIHESDRRLHAQLFETPESDFLRYRTWARHRIGLSPGLCSVVLPELARTGRCHLLPKPLGEQAISWRYFRQSSRIPKSVAEEVPPFDSFLEWPLLSEDLAGEPWQLELAFEPKAKKTLLQVVASLVRAEERKPLSDLQYLSGEGLALLGSSLVRCERSDTLLARRLARAPGVEVPVEQLADFIAESDRICPASRLVLPDGHELVSAGAPTPVLDLGKPSLGGVPVSLSFDYDGQRIDPLEHPGSLIDLGKGRWLRRNVAAEAQAREKLSSVGAGADLLPEKKLAQALHELLRSGFQVFAEGKRYRSASGIKVRVHSGVDWFELDGGADFEGVSMELPELLRGLKHRRLAVELGDGSFGLLPEEWLERWGILAEVAGERSKKLKLSTRQIGLLDLVLTSLPVEASDDTLARLRQRLEHFGRVEPAQPPQSFHGQLRPYQEHGLGWLRAMAELGFGACLADDMGLGKTVQVLAHLTQVHGKGAKPEGPTLVVVPRSLVNNWLDEARRFAPDLRVHVHWGAQRTAPENWPEADVVITTYALLRLDVTALARRELECVVLDEAQAIKNAASATARAAKLLRARQRLALTGTPVENHLGELWSLFDFLNPALITELPAVKQLAGRARPGLQGLELIRRLVRPFVLRRTKAEVARDLPERIEQTLYIELDEEERSEYDELFAHYRARAAKKLSEAGPEQSTAHVLEALLRLRQAACHPGLLNEERRGEHSSKLVALLEQLEALREEGHKALVFSQFTSMLGIVRDKLDEAGTRYEYLDGSTRDRAERVARFQSDPEISVFLISLKAGGLGLNLTAADYVFILDPWWNPAAEAQAIDRTHRIGQHRNVIAYRLLARGTVEERVAELQAKKRALVSALMEDTQNLSGRLTRKDLEALLDLGKR